ncbi:MAG TPA: NAD-dependent epimerase/dehydratase family protein [Chthoniobacterales bacterium]|jgi:dTDP-L-rhamnose 4-epimerase|nr:NAD-dependent epimerase/dehydratase family protein [Chthoniobacterales bacterium]
MKKALITGGAGFVGSHLADELLQHGYVVRALDNLSPQVHGVSAGRPDYLDPEVELLVGDVRDEAAVEEAIEGVDTVFHLAAAVGVGQSMYQIAEYTECNGMGTAVLLEALMEHPVERVVVASSMSIYGEGFYRDRRGRIISPDERQIAQLKVRDWEVRNAQGEALQPIPTNESKCPALPSVYAISKYHQERLCMTVCRAYGIEAVGLRFFNIYGSRQALSNPYTGVLAIFASRFLNDKPPLINEDGRQQRDFVSVHDIARACRLAMETPAAAGKVFNIGSGRSFSILEIAEKMARVLDKEELEPKITGKYRVGDIRNCFADISQARRVLGYEPQVTLEEGLENLAGWLEGQIPVDQVDAAQEELEARGLTV